MISPQYLDRVHDALRRLQTVDIDPAARERLAPIIRRLLSSVRRDDESSLRKALSDLLVAIARLHASTRDHGEESLRRGDTEIRATRPGVSGPADFQWVQPPITAPRPAPDTIREINALAFSLDSVDAGITRIPHIDVSVPGPIAIDTTFQAEVYLDTTPARGDESVRPFVLIDPPTSGDKLVIDVWLTVSAHFRIDGPSTDVIILDPTEQASTRAVFTVAVRDGWPDDAGAPMLKAQFDYQLRASGSVARGVSVAGVTGEVSREPEPDSGNVVLQTTAVPPDVEISVAKLRGAHDTYEVVIKTRLLGGVTVAGEWPLSGGAVSYVNSQMSDFTDPDATPLARKRALQGAGIQFFRDSPAEFRELYWRMVDADAPPKTVMVISAEPSVPWELMIPQRPGHVDRTPLGVQCAVGRWYADGYVAPGQWIPLRDSLVLAPDYEVNRLPHAAEERDLVLAKYPGRNVPATFDELDEFYLRNSASLLHFACHGEDETVQKIRLLNDQKLSAQQVLSGGLSTACSVKNPLVFLNACEVGRPGAGLIAPAGFAASFIACASGAVIAPLWAVDDEVAHHVAVAFYEAVSNDPRTPFAEILRGLRARAYEDGGDDSYAAYCFYGDPHAAAMR